MASTTTSTEPERRRKKLEPEETSTGERSHLLVGEMLLRAGALLLAYLDDKAESKPTRTTPTESSPTSQSVPSPIANDFPPWEAAHQRDPSVLPSGAVLTSEIAPSPPDPSEPPLATPREPPNPATKPPGVSEIVASRTVLRRARSTVAFAPCEVSPVGEPGTEKRALGSRIGRSMNSSNAVPSASAELRLSRHRGENHQLRRRARTDCHRFALRSACDA